MFLVWAVTPKRWLESQRYEEKPKSRSGDRRSRETQEAWRETGAAAGDTGLFWCQGEPFAAQDKIKTGHYTGGAEGAEVES